MSLFAALEEHIAALEARIAALEAGQTAKPAKAKAKAKTEEDTPKADAPAAPEAPVSVAPDDSLAPVVQAPAPVEEVKPEDVRSLAIRLSAEKGRETFMALLTRYGAATLRDLKKEDYAAFYAEMESLLNEVDA